MMWTEKTGYITCLARIQGVLQYATSEVAGHVFRHTRVFVRLSPRLMGRVWVSSACSHSPNEMAQLDCSIHVNVHKCNYMMPSLESKAKTTQPTIFRLYQTIAKKSCIRSVYRPNSDMIIYHI